MERITRLSRNPDFRALLLLAVLTFIFLLPAATMQGVYFLGDANDYFARIAYSATRLRAGQLPLWDPYLSLGGTHAGDPAALTWYAPALALFLLLPDTVAYNYTVILHIFLAAAGMHLLAAAWKLSPSAALVAAMVFGFGGFFVSHLEHLNIVVGLAWLPWLFLCIERYFEAGRARYLALGSLVLGLQILGGHTQIVLYGAATWGAYCLVRLARELRAERNPPANTRHLLAQIVGLALMVVGGLGVAAIFILPFAELLTFTARSDRVTFDYATSFSLEPTRVLAFVYPYLFGGNPASVEYGAGSLVEMTAYLGILPLALAVMALARREWRVYFLGALAVAALLLALGKFTPLYQLVYHLPLFGSVRAPSRFLMLFAFAVALLAGYGLEEIQVQKNALLRNIVMWTLVAVALVTGALLLLSRFGVQLPTALAQAFANPALLAAFALLLGAVAILYIWRRGLFTLQVRTVLTLALIFVDLLYFGWNFRDNTVIATDVYNVPSKNAPSVSGSDNTTYYWSAGETKAASLLQSGALEMYVALARAGLHQSLPLHLKVRSMEGYGTEPPAYADLMQLIQARGTFDQQTAALTALYGASYVLSAQPLGNAKLERVQRTGGVNLYQNTLGARIGRAHIVLDARPLADPAAIVQQLSSGIPNTGMVRLEGNVPASDPVTSAQATSTLTRDDPEHVTVDVTTNAAGWLVLNDTYYPGWRATLDDAPATLLRANALVRAVAVPAGEHHVDFVYDPLSVKIGGLLTTLSLILIGAVIGIDVWRERKNTARAQPAAQP